MCKYCGSSDIVIKHTKKRTIAYAVCNKHWKKYQQEKHEKRKKTNMELFGSVNPMYVTDISAKQKDTINTRSEKEQLEINKKREITNIEKYGVSYPIQDKKISEKRKQTIREKYGVDNVFHLKEVQDKIKNTNIEKYGVASPLQSTFIKDKLKATNIKNLGVPYPSQAVSVKDKITYSRRNTYWEIFIILLNNKYIEPLFSKEDYLNSKKELSYKCLKCLKIFTSSGTEPQRISCGCNRYRSTYEYEIFDWLNSINITNIETNKLFNKDGKIKFEIDIYLPEYNVGIDFHELYWHSNINCERLYHQKKALFFNDKGIKFIQIFENEWLANQELVKSIICSKLNKNYTIFARKCTIKTVSEKEYSEFIISNHIQGHAFAKIKLGLYYSDELVCVMALGLSRFKKENSFYEIIRFANKKGITVVGGFNKLFSFFERTYYPKKTVSFVDLRYFNGESYYNNGFKKESITSPNYFYFKKNYNTVIYNRFAFQKHKLKDKLDSFDPTLSESENMYKNGYLKIFDAGNLKMVKE